jgi:hypothetical protein
MGFIRIKYVFGVVLATNIYFLKKNRRLTTLDFKLKFDIILKPLKIYVLDHNI